jgi:hypothetical protein
MFAGWGEGIVNTMFAHVTGLRYWNSEHTERTCEDAWGTHVSAGLFVVADGAGTAVFANIWATLLAQHFLALPLMGNDPFEVEWWIRRAQEQFKQQTAVPLAQDWSTLQKLRQGSYTTLATLRCVAVDAAAAQTELLAVGDSCILIGRLAEKSVESFPLKNEAEFNHPPICLPSSEQVFQRYFHRCQRKQTRVAAGETVILATDAVARWIISCGGGRFANRWSAFEMVMQQSASSWAAFIEECRVRQEMQDDDCTALIITFGETSKEGDRLGTTTGYAEAIIQQRERDLAEALARQDAQMAAIYFGDGQALRAAGVRLPSAEVQRVRRVSDALRVVLSALREAIDSNSADAFARVRHFWEHHAALLEHEPCARSLVQTLRQKGLIPSDETLPLDAHQKGSGKAAKPEQPAEDHIQPS